MDQTGGQVAEDAPPPPSEAAKVLRRRVYDLVEGAYDEVRLGYRVIVGKTVSDQTIAIAAGCAVALVEKVREEFFGPAIQAEPVEEIKALQTELSYLRKEADTLEQMAKGMGTQAKELRGKIAASEQKIKDFCNSKAWGH